MYAVQVCLERRETQVVVLDGDTLKLVGLGNGMLASTFDAAVELGTFKAVDLAAALSLTPSNANNRLKRLTSIGSLKKKQQPTPPGGDRLRNGVRSRGGEAFPLTPA